MMQGGEESVAGRSSATGEDHKLFMQRKSYSALLSTFCAIFC